ncbi:hypothetical protein M404DRAFT_53767, partial [Pisolithus tinctorius Marx 270]
MCTAFLASCTGAHSGSTLANYMAGLHAWYIMHSCKWDINEVEYKAILAGATKLALHSSKRSRQAPFTVDILIIFHSLLNHKDPCNTAIFACLVVSFYCIARLGEFTVPSIQSFNPAKHIT